MPYFVTDKADGCSGWATIKADGEVIGCHKTKVEAVAQMVAVSLSEKMQPGGERKDSGPQAVIVDIDGTLIQSGRRVEKVYNFLDDMSDTKIFIVTGRNVSGRDSTAKQLNDLGIDYDRLFMNPDSTADTADFKKLTGENLLKEYNVILAIDNNPTMRKVYRDLGITALDVPDVPKVSSDENDPDEERIANISVPTYMRAAARRGLELNRQGFGGDGLTDKTLAEARAMADGRVSEDKWRRIGPWIARHLVDLDAPKNNNPDDSEYPGAGLVAHLLWGSGPTKARAVAAANYAENVVEKLDENRHLPGGHDQKTHGAGGSGPYVAGSWTKASAIDKKAILERRYGAAADKAVGGELTREQKIKEMARIDQNNIDNRNNEVWMNGENHTIIFTRNTKNMDVGDKEKLFNDVDAMQTKYPLDQMDVEVSSDWRGTKGMASDRGAAAYTTNDGLKIGVRANYVSGIYAETPEQLAREGFVVPFGEKQFMGSVNRVPVSKYTMAHEWGHAWESKQLKLANVTGRDRLRYEINRDVNLQKAIKEGNLRGGFMSIYGKTGNSESYAEAFADFYLSNGKPTNAVTQEMAKEFKW
jgi:hypothetical protein